MMLAEQLERDQIQNLVGNFFKMIRLARYFARLLYKKFGNEAIVNFDSAFFCNFILYKTYSDFDAFSKLYVVCKEGKEVKKEV